MKKSIQDKSQKFQKKFQVAELVRIVNSFEIRKRNPSKKGGRYYSCHRKMKNNYMFSKRKSQYCRKEKNRLSWRVQIFSLKKREKLETDNLFQSFRNKREIRYMPIVCW